MPAPRKDQMTKEGARHLARARRLSVKIEEAREAQSRYASERATAVRAAIEAGVSKAQVARELGITGPAVAAILNRHERRPEPTPAPLNPPPVLPG